MRKQLLGPAKADGIRIHPLATVLAVVSAATAAVAHLVRVVVHPTPAPDRVRTWWPGVLQRALRVMKTGLIRIYALAIALVLIWASYAAVAYLVRTVYYPTSVPARMLEWSGHVDAASLRAPNALGLARTAPRAPLGHYHGVDRWFQPDPHNDCTTSDCHSPLPHRRSAEMRAFANFHTTFLNCRMCHQASANRPLAARWIDTSSARLQEAPAILRLVRYLEMHAVTSEKDSRDVHRRILDLLGRTIRTSGHDPLLEYLRVQIETSEPGSPVWRQSIQQLKAELPLHLRGEYGAKLAPTRPARLPSAADGSRASDSLPADHVPLGTPVRCRTCHTTDSLAGFQSLGYSPQRAALLSSLPLARLFERTRDGRRFHLPEMLGEQGDQREHD